VSTTSGTITIEANDSIIFSEAGDVTTNTSGDVVVTADADATTTVTEAEVITMTDTGADTTLITSAGTVSITNTSGGNGGDITLANIVAGDTTDLAVIISTDADVLDAGDTVAKDIIAGAGAGGVTIDGDAIYSADTLEVQVDFIDIDNAGAGPDNLIINNMATNAVTIQSLTTADGSITYNQTDATVTTGQALTINTLTTGDGAIVIDNSGGVDADIAIGLVTTNSTIATGDAVTIDSSGAITDAGNDIFLDVQGLSVTMNAVEGVGATTANGAIDVIASTVSSTNTISGGVFINNQGGTSAGTGTVTFSSVLANGAGDVELFAATDILIGDVDAVGSVKVATSAGAIDDLSVGDTTVIDITAGTTIVLDATTGIGATEELELGCDADGCTGISADTTTGAIDLIANVTSTAPNLPVTSLTTTLADITFTQIGDDVVAFNDVQTTGLGNDISLNALDGIETSGTISTTLGGNIVIDADTDFGTSDLTGTFSQTGGLITTGAGDPGDLTVRGVDFNFAGTLTVGTGTFNLVYSQQPITVCLGVATGILCGSELDNTDLFALATLGSYAIDAGPNNILAEDADLAGADASFTATTIDDVETTGGASIGILDANSLTLTTADSGIFFAGAIGGASVTASGLRVDDIGLLTVVDTAGNDVTITNTGAITTTYDIATGGGGNVSVTQTASNLDVDNITTTADVTLTATTGNITDFNTADDTTTNIVANNITLNALNGSIGATGGDPDLDITLGGTLNADTSTGTGGIFIQGTGALFLGTVQTDGAAGDVELNANGTITDGGALSLIADSLVLDAVGGINLDTRALVFDVDNITSGSTDIVNDTVTAAVTITKMNNAPAGTIIFTQTGSGTGQQLIINDMDTSNGDITISNTGGTSADILIGQGLVPGVDAAIVAGTAGNTVLITAGGSINDAQATTIDLNAGTGIGNSDDVDIDGTTVSIDTTDGAIDIESNASGPVSVTSLATDATDTGAGGAVSFNQTGDQQLTIAGVSTSDGDITVSNCDVVACTGGTNNDITIGAVTTLDTTNDTISIISSGGALTSTGTLTAANLTIGLGGAGAAIGSSGTPLDTVITNNFVLTTNTGDIFIDDANAPTISSSNLSFSAALSVSLARL